MSTLRTGLICFALSLAACGGGGGATSTPASVSPQLVRTSFTFTQSATVTAAMRKRPQYVGAGTQSVTIALQSVNGTPAVSAATTLQQNVALTTCPCTIAGPAVPAGSDVFTISTYDGQYVSGVQGGNVISTATAPATIGANGVNAIGITLNGVAASYSLGLVPTGAAAGTPIGPTPLDVIAKDADAHTILGTYATPITVSDADTSGATTIAIAGSDSPPAGSILSSGDTISFSYSGLAIAPSLISVSSPGVTPATLPFQPALQPIVPQTTSLNVYQVMGAEAANYSEIGWSDAPYNQSFQLTTNCGSAVVLNLNVTVIAVSAGTYSSNGICTVVISDFPGGNTVNLTLNYFTGGPP